MRVLYKKGYSKIKFCQQYTISVCFCSFCFSATVRTRLGIQCLPYAGFKTFFLSLIQDNLPHPQRNFPLYISSFNILILFLSLPLIRLI